MHVVFEELLTTLIQAEPLSKRETLVRDAFKSLRNLRGIWPTQKEVADVLGLNPATVCITVKVLIAKGHMENKVRKNGKHGPRELCAITPKKKVPNVRTA